MLFWTATDLEMKLSAFRDYYNEYRVHSGVGKTPIERTETKAAILKLYRWCKHCRLRNADRGMRKDSAGNTKPLESERHCNSPGTACASEVYKLDKREYCLVSAGLSDAAFILLF